MTKGSILQTVRINLGYSSVEGQGVSVELTDEQITTCITNALQIYNRYSPIEKRAVIQATPGVQQYDVTLYAGEVVEVTPQQIGTGYSYDSDIFSMSSGILRTTDAGDYALTLKDYNERMSAVGARFDWEYERDPQTKKAYLYVAPLGRPLALSIKFLVPHGIETINEDDNLWFLKYVQALSEIILAKMRGKYGSIPGMQSPVDMGASSLLTEAKSNLEKLETEIRSRPRRTLILKG